MGILAYTLGLRHAFDADHIALLIIQLLQQNEILLELGFTSL